MKQDTFTLCEYYQDENGNIYLKKCIDEFYEYEKAYKEYLKYELDNKDESIRYDIVKNGKFIDLASL